MKQKRRIPESELIINTDGSAFHIHIRPEELADTVILVGDPGRVEMFKPLLADIEMERSSREFHSLTGYYNGKRITVLSTGIGTDNIDIVMTELDALANIDFKTREEKEEHKTLTILRIGTCGSIQPDVPIGTFIFSDYSLGFDGMINWYADRDKCSNPDMEKSLVAHMNWDAHLPAPYCIRASEELIARFENYTTKGITISAPGFYGPQGRVVRIPLAMPDMLERLESFKFGDYRILNFEMESSAVAAMSRHLGHNGGTVCCAIANRYLKNSDTQYHDFMEDLVKLALDRLTA